MSKSEPLNNIEKLIEELNKEKVLTKKDLITELSQIKEKISKIEETAEAKYSDIFNSVIDGIFYFDSNGTIQVVNSAFRDLTGLSNGELEGNNLFSIISKYTEFTEAEKLNQFFRKVLTENINEEIQFTFNGKVLKAKVSKSQSSENFTAIVFDITEKLADKIKLQESEAYNKILFEDSKIPLVVIDASTNKFVDLNDSALHIYGYSNKTEVLGKTPADVSTPTQYNGEISRLAAEKQIEKALKFGEIVFEWRHQNPDGKIWDAEVNLMKFTFRGKEYLQFSLLDITQRKIAHDLLITSEENYRQLVELAPDAIVVHSNGKFVYVNNSAVKIIGANSKEDLIGKSVLSIVHPDSVHLARERIMKIMQTGEAVELVEEKLIKFDGTNIFTEIVAAPLIYNGQHSIITIVRDITEHKNAINKLQSSEKKYRELSNLMRLMTDNMPDMLWAKDLNKNYIFVNKAVCENLLNATDVEEPIGKNDLFFARRERESHPENPNWHTFGELCQNTDDETLIAKKALQFDEFGNVKGEFLFLDVHKSPLIDENGNIIGVVGSARDITEKQRIYEKLTENEKLFRSISNLTSDYLFYTKVDENKKPHLFWVSENFSKISGYTIEEFIQIGGWQKTILPEDLPIDQKAFNDLLGNKSVEVELRLIHKNGNIIWVKSYGSPIWDEKNSRLEGIVGAVQDITEKKHFLNQIIEAKEKAEVSEKIKTEFLSQMSHEIRSPLNVVLSYISILQEIFGENADEDVQKAFASIDSASRRIIRTIDLILNMTDLQLGTYEPTFTKFDYVKILKAILGEYQQSAKVKKLDLILEINGKETEIYSDDYAFLHIITNLVDNAVKYTKEGSVKIISTKLEDKLKIEVVDTGIGMTEEFLPRLFTAFTQEQQGYHRHYEGNGLGMALIKKYCDLIQAEIKVESKKGKGTKFTIIFNSKTDVKA